MSFEEMERGIMIVGILEDLQAHYIFNRAIGHTHAMIEGTKNTPEAVVVVGNGHMGRVIREKSPGTDTVSIRQIEQHGALRGRRCPLVVDNAALDEILGRALLEIYSRGAEIDKLNEEIAKKNSLVVSMNQKRV